MKMNVFSNFFKIHEMFLIAVRLGWASNRAKQSPWFGKRFICSIAWITLSLDVNEKTRVQNHLCVMC